MNLNLTISIFNVEQHASCERESISEDGMPYRREKRPRTRPRRPRKLKDTCGAAGALVVCVSSQPGYVEKRSRLKEVLMELISLKRGLV